MKANDVLTHRDKQGFVEHMPFDDYKAVSALNCSTITAMEMSPFHFKAAFEADDGTDTDSMQWGRAVHIGAFQPDLFEAHVWQAEGRRTAKAKAEAKENGAELLKPGDVQFGYDSAVQAVLRMSELNELKPFLESGQPELSGFVVENEMQCKFRLDWLSSRHCIVDLKTTRSMESFAFSRDFYRLHYDVKLGMYQYWTARLLDGRPADIPVYLLLLENKPPFDCMMAPRYAGRPIPIDQAILDRGATKGLEWITEIRGCLYRDDWPGMASRDEWSLNVPSWEMDEDEIYEG